MSAQEKKTPSNPVEALKDEVQEALAEWQQKLFELPMGLQPEFSDDVAATTARMTNYAAWCRGKDFVKDRNALSFGIEWMQKELVRIRTCIARIEERKKEYESAVAKFEEELASGGKLSEDNQKIYDQIASNIESRQE